MKTILTTAIVGLMLSGAAYAGHANPWATDDTELKEQYHERNQAFSEDRPGESEMHGKMFRHARGKLEFTTGEQGGFGGHGGAGSMGGFGGHGHGKH